jgi:CTP synthase (UTP-ammonia lyase)
MADSIKIAIIGDFNFTLNAHHATNLAIDHSTNLLDIEVNYYWIRLSEAANYKASHFTNFDGVWIAPGPFENTFLLNGIVNMALNNQLPIFITGEGFRVLLDVLIRSFNLNPNQEKLISDNLSPTSSFEKIEVTPISNELKKLYNENLRIELTSSRYSIYPQLMEYLQDELIDIEALNQFEEPEVISLKSRPFCLASMSLPQICSTREMPHPLVSAFLNFAHGSSESIQKSKTG